MLSHFDQCRSLVAPLVRSGSEFGASPLSFGAGPAWRDLLHHPGRRGSSRVELAVASSSPTRLLELGAPSGPGAFSSLIAISPLVACVLELVYLSSFKYLRACCLGSTGIIQFGPSGTGCLAQVVT